MPAFYKRIELLANIAIIVVALLLGIVLVKRHLLPSTSTAVVSDLSGGAALKPGTRLPLTGVQWDKSDRTLLMVLSTTCHFCNDSAPFYQRLAHAKSGHAEARIIAVLPQNVDQAQQYLNEHGVTVDEITQSAPGAAYARATPTLIMVDRTGSVVESWVGRLPVDKEAEVLNHLLEERASN
jgi:hypothetical protein